MEIEYSKEEEKYHFFFFWSKANIDLCSCGKKKRLSKDSLQTYFNKTSYCSKKCLNRKVNF